MKKHIFPGLRTIKTALAVFICVLTVSGFSDFFTFEMTGFFAGITAVFTLQATVGDTKDKARNRILGTLIGASVAVVLSFVGTLLGDVIGAGVYVFVGIVIVIHSCYWLDLNDGVLISCILVLACFTRDSDSYLLYALVRTVETFWGAFVAYMVNLLLFKYEG